MALVVAATGASASSGGGVVIRPVLGDHPADLG
jgi:hypothetical protein